MPGTCVAINCNNQFNKNSGITLHGFPHNNPALLKKWQVAMKRDKWKPTIYSKLCSDHFEPSCFRINTNDRRYLHENSVPTKFCFSAHLEKMTPATRSQRKQHADKQPETIYNPIASQVLPETSDHNYCVVANSSVSSSASHLLKPVYMQKMDQCKVSKQEQKGQQKSTSQASVAISTSSRIIPKLCEEYESTRLQKVDQCKLPNWKKKQQLKDMLLDFTSVARKKISAKGSVAASTPEQHHSFEPSHVRKGTPYKVPNLKQEEELEMILLHLKRQILLLEVEKLSEERERIAVEKRNITLRNNILALRTKLCESEKTSSTVLISHVSSPAVSLNRECVGSRAVKGSVKGSSIIANQAVDTLPCTQYPHKSSNPKLIPNSTHGVVEDRMQPAGASSSVNTPESVLPDISESMHHPIPPVTVASDKQKEPANEQTACNNIDSGHTLSCKETETSEHPSSTFMNGCTAWSEQMVQSGEPYFKDLDKKPPSQTLFPDHESLNSGEAFNEFYVVSGQVGDESAPGTVKRDSSMREEPIKKRKLEY